MAAVILQRGLALAFVFMMTFGGMRAHAQTTELLPLNHLWRYEGSGADLGSAWRAISYDDSTWPAGPGVLATWSAHPVVDALTQTELSRTGTNGVYKITDYFRTRFTVPEVRPGWFVTVSDLVDDGAVFYLNGTEWFRQNMPAGVVNALTLASQVIGEGQEGVFTITNLPGTNLLAGENVLAVEVHQPYISSSDTVLGVALLYAPQQPVVITAQPAHRVVEEGDPVSLNVGITGSIARYQWFKDGLPILGATQPALSLAETRRSDAGLYFVVVSNDVSAVTSHVAAVTVSPDTQAPTLLEARRTSLLYVRFSERLDRNSVTNPASYHVTAPGAGTLAVNRVFINSQYAVELDTEPLTPGFGHLLFVNGVRDRFGNVIEPDSGIAVGAITTTVTNVPLASAWRYNDSGADLGVAWRGWNYDDGGWPSGLALLYNDVNLSLSPPGVRGQMINVTNAQGSFVTHYFRQRFTNAASPVGTRVTLRYYLDDGAIFYLNGQELYRVNMPSGEVSFQTRAQSSGSEGVFSSPVTSPATNLVVGENVLAVEVHQYSLSSPILPDISFGVELSTEVKPSIEGPPGILSQPQDARVNEGGKVRFLTQVAGAEGVQWLRDGVPVLGGTSPELELAAARPDLSGGYSLLASNSYGAVTSRIARLTVVPDLIPPRLLSARMGTNEALVMLTFSEAIDLDSAVFTGNYAITNELGQRLTVLSAVVTNGTNVILITTARSAGERYAVGVNRVRDSSAAANVIPSGSHTGIEHETLLFTYDWVWNYNDLGADLGVAWRERDYDDSTWAMGPGLLGFEDPARLPAPLGTQLPPPEYRGVTYYFRTRFDFTGDPASTVLRLRHAIDDGAVFFLNGREIHRIRVAEGQNYLTLAATVAKTQIEGPFDLPNSALVAGGNVLAVEVHQNSSVSEDMVFGAELTETFLADPPLPTGPFLQLHHLPEGPALLWDALDFALEQADAPTGPWQLVAQPTWPFFLQPTGNARFYRLQGQR